MGGTRKKVVNLKAVIITGINVDAVIETINTSNVDVLEISSPQGYDDVFEIYHNKVYPYYLNDRPVIYVIKDIKDMIKKLQNISDPAPVACPLTGEKLIRHLERIQQIKDIQKLKEWLHHTLTQEDMIMEVKTPLDPEQQKAAAHYLGPALVVSPAGSGKTSTVIVRISLLIKRGVLPESILCITFTKKTQTEMQERLIRAIGKEKGSKVMVKTFHALAYMLISEITGKKPVMTNRMEVLIDIVRSIECTVKIDVLSKYISYQLNALKLPQSIIPSNDEEKIMVEVYRLYLEVLDRQNEVDQDTMLLQTYL